MNKEEYIYNLLDKLDLDEWCTDLYKVPLTWCELYDIRDYINLLQQENKQLKEQLDYIRSGEYYNQLRFERDMLQDLVEKGEIPKEDKEFIDCTHRNTELLEENKQLKERVEYLERSNNRREDTIISLRQELNDIEERVDKAREILGKYKHYSVPDEKQNSDNEELVNNAYEILKGDSNE